VNEYASRREKAHPRGNSTRRRFVLQTQKCTCYNGCEPDENSLTRAKMMVVQEAWMSLKDYENKRDFSKTSEPKPEEKQAKPERGLFVVHKHKATRLHYDFRLEVEGVLKSWAVPKGPSMNPADKRLAVMVEDHPYDYKDFEGVIPQDEYGAGSVMIWDEGNYTVQEGTPADALENGQMKLVLNGKKLKGGFALVQTRMRGKEENWLLIKEKDDYALRDEDILKERPKSARSGRSLQEVAQHES
jgi:bifunctional non-homologous end joining protein LigD